MPATVAAVVLAYAVKYATALYGPFRDAVDVTIALLERSLWERFAISVVLGGTFLLTLHTSHVRERGFRIGVVLVLFAIPVSLWLAAKTRLRPLVATVAVCKLVAAVPRLIAAAVVNALTVAADTNVQNVAAEAATADALAALAALALGNRAGCIVRCCLHRRGLVALA